MMTPWNFPLFFINPSGNPCFFPQILTYSNYFHSTPLEISIDIPNREFEFFSGEAHCKIVYFLLFLMSLSVLPYRKCLSLGNENLYIFTPFFYIKSEEGYQCRRNIVKNLVVSLS